jgi:DNA (cytosine-5)-methyltransferase 3A
MNVMSLFDGISCGRVAFERANINVKRYISFEIDENAIKVSKNNYNDIEYHGDVFNANFKDYNNIDIVIGGSPCQYWSIARMDGNREITFDGIGAILFNRFRDAVVETNCKYFIYENNFSMNINIKKSITKSLGVEPIMINSNLVSGQTRKRLYWTNIPNISQPCNKKILMSDIIKTDRKWKDVGKWVYSMWGETSKLDSLKFINCDKSNTLTTSKTHPRNYYVNDDKTKYTNLDSEEWEQLQTLPIGYTSCVKEGVRHKLLGNAWTVDVIVHILNHIP